MLTKYTVIHKRHVESQNRAQLKPAAMILSEARDVKTYPQMSLT